MMKAYQAGTDATGIPEGFDPSQFMPDGAGKTSESKSEPKVEEVD